MKRVWKKIERMIKANVKHKRKNFRLGDAGINTVLAHAIEEFKELSFAPDDPAEMADLLGILIHYCIKQGWTIEFVEAKIIEKLDLRFDKVKT